MASPRCPRCRRGVARRTPRQSALDEILAVVYVYPFRCQLCALRFRSLQWGVRYARRTDDRREYERLAVELTGTLSVGAQRSAIRVSDLSLGGCTVRTDLRLAIGTLVDLALRPTDGEPLVVEGSVVRSTRDGVLGIAFGRMGADARMRLEVLVLALTAPRVATSDVTPHATWIRWRLLERNILLLVIVLAIAAAAFFLFPTVQFCRKSSLC
jgi:PilZ domain-containing protein